MACLCWLKSASHFVFWKKHAGCPTAFKDTVVLGNIPDFSVGKKILVVYLIFGCGFALAVYLFRCWQRRSGRPKPRPDSYAGQLTDRFDRNRKRQQKLRSTSKTKSARSVKR